MAVSLNGAMREFDKRVHAGLMYPSYNMIWNEQFHPIVRLATLPL